MLFWLDFHQTQSNLYKWFRMQRHDWSSTSKRAHFSTPLFVSLHWLPVAARIKFKTLMLAYRTATGSAPSYFHSLLRIYIPPEAPPTSTHYYESTSSPEAPPTSHSLLRIYIPSRSLRSASEATPSWYHYREAQITLQNILVHRSWPVEWSPPPSGTLGSRSIFKQQLKTHLFQQHYLTYHKYIYIKYNIYIVCEILTLDV